MIRVTTTAKSAICESFRYLCKVVANACSLIDACYFFGRGMGDREKASFFPATIAYQLIDSRSSCGDEIRAILAKKPSLLRESFPSQFRKLVLGPAKALAKYEAPITIVIDALDECDSASDQVALLDAILEANAKANMRFVIAGRPEEHIQAFFRRENVSQHTYHIRLDGDFKANSDIEIFLRRAFARIRQQRPGPYCCLSNGEEWPGSVVIYQLRDDSDGQFIYAKLVITFIDTSYPPPDQQLKSLLAAPPARAFSKLDALYHHILSRYPPGVLEGSDELLEFQKLVTDILRAIVSWPRTLSITGIAKVLNKEADVVRAVIHGPMCLLFKYDSTDFDSIITLCHKSLRDYLLDRLRSQEFYLEDADTPGRLYSQILSHQPPSIPSQSYSREVLMGVLSIVVERGDRVTVPQIASFLDVVPSVVESIVFGPTKMLFNLGWHDNVDFTMSSFKDFLLDASRSGKYFVSSQTPDTLFTQVLSRQQSSNPARPYSQQVLMDILVVLVTWSDWLSISEIASVLGVQLSLVEGIVLTHAQLLFYSNSRGQVTLSLPVLDFLRDSHRAGKFCIPSKDHNLNYDFLYAKVTMIRRVQQ